MDVFIGFITPFPWNWAPYQWSLCNGGVLPVTQNAALYSLLGNVYGGDQVNFNLPDLRGRQIVGMGQRPGSSNFNVGDHAGAESVTLAPAQVPLAAHIHPATFTPSGSGGSPSLSVSTAAPSAATPLLTNGQTAYLANSAAGGAGNALKGLYTTTAPAAGATATIPVNSGTGGGTVTVNANNPTAAAAVSLMNPYLALNFCIALYGLYPTRN